jgi:hypothetical protein
MLALARKITATLPRFPNVVITPHLAAQPRLNASMISKSWRRGWTMR